MMDDAYGLALYGAELESAKLHKNEGRFVAGIRLHRLISAAEDAAISAQLALLAEGFSVTFEYIPYDNPLLNGGFDELTAIIEETMAFYHPIITPAFAGARWAHDGQNINLTVAQSLLRIANNAEVLEKTEGFLQRVYQLNTHISILSDEEIALPPRATGLMLEDASPNNLADITQGKNKGKAKGKKTSIDKKDIIYGKVPAKASISMNTVDEASGVITVCGEIRTLDIRDTKNGGGIINLTLSDRTNTLPVKVFLKKNERIVAERVRKCHDNGDFLTVHGSFTFDSWSKTHCIFADGLCRSDPVLREDNAKDKRVELHLHTQMSSLDGLVKVEEAIKTAARWGHKAVAITDHGVVQAFPAAIKAGAALNKAGNDIKVILGLEGYLLPDCSFIGMDGEFCALGMLSYKGMRGDNIYELCAVRLDMSGIKDVFVTLVNPGVAMPPRLRERTGISEEMLNNAPTTSQALKQLIEYCGDAPLVLHDKERLQMLYKAAQQFGTTELRHNCVSTGTLMHYLHRAAKDVSLRGAMRFLNIDENYDRAEGRARATARLLIGLADKMRAINENRLPLFDALPREHIKGQRSNHHIILIAKNQVGLKNLYRLVSYSHTEHFRGVPRIPRSLLTLHREGLILGTACEAGELFCAVLDGKGEDELRTIANEYDYLEVQPIGNNEFMLRSSLVADMEGLRGLNKRIVELGESMNKPVVATGDVHFLDPDDAIYRAILMSARDFKDAEQQAPLYFKTTEEMLEEFAYLGKEKAQEIVVDNPNMIADACEKLKPFLSDKGTYAPTFPGADEELRTAATQRAHEVYGDVLPDVVKKRLEFELNSIINNGYASLYLVAQRLVKKSMADGYLVGSRGSVGSSFVATMAGITEVNPLQPHYVCPVCKHSDFNIDRKQFACGVDLPPRECPECGSSYNRDGYDILFEVFLGFEGDKTPDIDLNFSGEYQSEAHRFTEEMFGEGHAFRAGTISAVKDKTVYGYVMKYCEAQGLNLTHAEIERLIEGCTGVKRTTGQHPGGIVIVPEEYDIEDFTPIQFPADKQEKNTVTTHFDFHALDDKLVKLDILGHDDPTALKMLHGITGMDPLDIPLDDAETMKLYSSTEPLGVSLEELDCEVGSLGVPEFGTGFVRGMLKDTCPTRFEELVRIAGLSHGTDVWLGNAKDLVVNGTATLSEVICTRDDIMNYLIHSGGDPRLSFKTMESVRKGHGITEEMESAMHLIDAPEWFINSCKKIKYLFPRAHSAAYVMMSFRVAYYKVHFPEAFYAVYFTVRADAFDVARASGGAEKVLANIKTIQAMGNDAEQKEQDLLTILEVVYEMNLRGIKLLPVDLYKSQARDFTLESGGVRAPFSSIAGVGENAAVGIADARGDYPFTSIEDFKLRTKANSAVIAALRELGCFEGLAESSQMTLF